jgi:cytochrome c nitrite reductase small subunit
MRAKTPVIIVLGIVVGLAAGLGTYTFIYARGYSYFSNNPAACTNCHVMRGYYDGWAKSSHHAVATCNDCHTPPNLIGKYATKTANGFSHSLAFTRGAEPDAILIKARNHSVTEAACRNCHKETVSAMETVHRGSTQRACTHCHGSVGHSEALASSRIPLSGE